MPDAPEGEPQDFQDQIADLVRRALLQAGDIQDVEQKLKEISQRASKITPPPKKDEGKDEGAEEK
jgi:hypothetical protein